MRNAKKTIVLTDSSKASLTAMHQYASWNEIDCLITDNGLSKEIIEGLTEHTDIVLV